MTKIALAAAGLLLATAPQGHAKDTSWHLLTRSYGGTVTLLSGLSQHECEEARLYALGYEHEYTADLLQAPRQDDQSVTGSHDQARAQSWSPPATPPPSMEQSAAPDDGPAQPMPGTMTAGQPQSFLEALFASLSQIRAATCFQ